MSSLLKEISIQENEQEAENQQSPPTFIAENNISGTIQAINESENSSNMFDMIKLYGQKFKEAQKIQP